MKASKKAQGRPRKGAAAKLKTIGVRIPPDLELHLQALALKHRSDVSRTARRLIETGLLYELANLEIRTQGGPISST
jgi:hypothetical protein